MPVNASSDTSDPTREIRSLVDQLQQSARDARNQIRTAEAERDDMAAQANHFRQQNEELRARFIEITSIIRERDAALEEVERMSRTLTDHQVRQSGSSREIAEANRQRDEALQQRKELLTQRNDGMAQQALLVQQRDELNRQLEIATISGKDASWRLAEVQKQLVSIREARDAAQARTGEQGARIAAQQEEIVTLRDELELLRVSSKGAIGEELWKAVCAERDQARAEAERLGTELTALRAAHEAAQQTAGEAARELVAERERAAAVFAGQAEAQKILDEATRRMVEAENHFTELCQERAVALAAREETITSLKAAQQKIERLIRDRDALRHQNTESVLAQETQLEALRAQLAIFESTNPEAAQHTSEVRALARRLSCIDEERRELAHRLEKQREETVDLAAQLQTAHDQIRQMSANLAEARLQTRLSAKSSTPVPTPAPVNEAPAPLPAPVFDSGESVSAMRQACQGLLRDPENVSFLNEIAGHAAAYAKLAGASRIVAVERLGRSFSELASELFEYPDRISPDILRTIQQTVEFLATLATTRDLATAKDPASARVFTVDDEPGCCEVVRRVMESLTMQTGHAQDPAKALTELASQQYDLIFLDVNMPGINGFELCAQIRSLSVNSSTPVIFLTGYNTTENRLQSTMSGGNEFVGKPFLFPELTTKALTLMLKAQFHLA